MMKVMKVNTDRPLVPEGALQVTISPRIKTCNEAVP